MHRVLVRCTAFRVTSCVTIVVMYIVSEEDIEELIRTFGAKCDSAELSQVYASSSTSSARFRGPMTR